MDLNSDSDNDLTCTPPEIPEIAQAFTMNLLPERSKKASFLMLAVAAINGFTMDQATNTASNQFSPFARIHENHMQNSYVNDAGYGGYGGFGGFGGLLGPLSNGIRINHPISHSTNLFSEGAGIFNNDVQNSYQNRGYF